MSGPPSFSSFPPTFGSFPELEPGPSKSSGDSLSAKDKDKHKKTKSKSKREDRDGRERRRDDRDEDEGRRKKKPKRLDRTQDEYLDAKRVSIPRESVENLAADSATRSFYSDRKGDILNVKYGGLHAGDVPKYNLVARGRHVLGLDKAFIVLHRGRHGLEVGMGSRRRVPELTDSKTRRLLQAAPTRRLIQASDKAYKYEEVDGFLRLPSSKRSAKEIEDYRDIAADPAVDSDFLSSSSGEEDSDAEDSDFAPGDSRQATLKELESQLTSDPTSIPTWFALLSNTLSTVPLQSKNAPKVRAEMSLSILTRALSAHPSNEKCVKLRLKLLSVGEELWNSETLHDEWEKALNIGNTELWMSWLDWRIRTPQNGLDGLIRDAERVLFAMGKDEVAALRVFWRVAIAFRDAGFIERAMAMFQAQAELAFKRPQDLAQSSFDTVLDRLEAFWESEVPRLGEPGATGWAAWEAAGSPEAVPGPSRVSPRPPKLSDPFARWAAQELIEDDNLQMPSRSFDEEECNDPYSTILFSDIRPLLVRLTYPGSKQAFRLTWLSFLGLHFPGFSPTLSADPLDSTDDKWTNAHLKTPPFLRAIFPDDSPSKRITADSAAGILVGRERSYSSAFCPVKDWSLDAVDVMEGAIAGKYRIWMNEDAQAVTDYGLVREVFQQCTMPGRDAQWDILRLAFETLLDSKHAVKVSKGFVAKDQDSLAHWKAHARLERLRGRVDDARKVYRTVLAATNAGTPDVGQLWWDWAEMEWLSGSSEAALHVVLRSTGTNGSGSVVILRSKRELDDIYRNMPSDRWKEREAWLNLRALLELLTSSPLAAIAIYDAELSQLSPSTEAHESLTIASLSMLYIYGTILRLPLAPGPLRERAEAAIQLYPNNTIILGLFLEAEKGQAVWGRVKLMLGDNEAHMDDKGLLRRVAEIWAVGWEKGSWREEEERIRSKFSAAVQSDRTRGSAILWRMYLEFEIRTGRLKQAKMLLFRAIRECPTVKELYLLAFGPLRSLFTPRELSELGDTMAERGIRMRRALNEAVEGWVDTSSREAVGETEDVGEDEIEYNAEELRRLRPY